MKTFDMDWSLFGEEVMMLLAASSHTAGIWFYKKATNCYRHPLAFDNDLPYALAFQVAWRTAHRQEPITNARFYQAIFNTKL
jgi:hypothetical protein